MREALKLLVVDEYSKGITKTTRKGLIARGMLTESGQLTESGYQQAIALLPLTKQCKMLGLPLIHCRCETPMGPEIGVLMALDNVGVDSSTFDEGLSILAALHAKLRPSILAFPQIRDEMFVFASLSVIRTEIGAEAYRNKLRSWLIGSGRPEHASIVRSARNLRVLESSKKKTSVTLAASIVNDISMRAGEIGEFLDSPYNARSGWPDIAFINDGCIGFIEVKTSDKLISSQIYNILALPKFLAARLLVIKVVKKDSEPLISEVIEGFLRIR
jgi:hypothetical protein